MVTYEPSGDRMIVEPIKEATKIGLIYTPTNEDKSTQRAIIKALSVDLEQSGMSWEVGNEVLLERFSGQHIPGGLVLVGQAEVLAKIERTADA